MIAGGRFRRVVRRNLPSMQQLRAQPIVVRSSPSCGRADEQPVPWLCSQTRGLRVLPTPAGVPVETMSPGTRVISLREVGDELGDAEDQVLGARVLHPLAVEVEGDPDRRGVADLVGGDQRRPAGRGAVEDLARESTAGSGTAGRGRRGRLPACSRRRGRALRATLDLVGRLRPITKATSASKSSLELAAGDFDLARRRRPARSRTWRRRSAPAGGSIPASAAWSA